LLFTTSTRKGERVVVIAESHISVHTWPENVYAALDIYTCGEKANPRVAFEYIKEQFQAEFLHCTELDRGLPCTGRFIYTQKHSDMTDWIQFHDHIHESETHLHGLSRILIHQQTAYQTILIAESSFFGKILIIDGDVQSAQADEYRYHESLVHRL